MGIPGADVVAVGSLTCLVLSPTQPSAFAGRGGGTCPTGRRLHSSPTAGNVGSGVLSSDVSGQVMRKIGALSAYRSQFALEPDMFPEFLLRDIFGREYFVAATADRPVRAPEVRNARRAPSALGTVPQRHVNSPGSLGWLHDPGPRCLQIGSGALPARWPPATGDDCS